MKFILSSAAALVATAAAGPLDRRASPLQATLTQVDNTLVRVALTNTGSTSYNLLAGGSVLDDAPVDKLYVTGGNATAEFIGITKRLALQNLEPEAFVTLGAGETIEKEIQAAQLYDFPASGVYEIFSDGIFPYAEVGSTELSGNALIFQSNKLSIEVDSEAAAATATGVHLDKRTIVQSDCTGTRLTAVTNGLRNCASQANAAASQAASGSATRFQEFFRTTAASNRNSAAARFRAVAADCASSTSGRSRTYCTDPYGFCTSGVLAYAVPRDNNINYCPAFYSLPAVTGRCNAQDQAGTVLHEETHVPNVYSPSTVDHAYGYAASTRLSAAQALLNADTYTLFANAVALNC
ncbi:putative peptidase M35, deuterolysin, metallopeptidase, catalytic domain superfamily [Septoria linicola]|nr:putative peptidase M35, deuterolysin, metallopeptidase, catalytic domain superfamily [Septoria linicola]